MHQLPRMNQIAHPDLVAGNMTTPALAAWHARLELQFAARQGADGEIRTVLARKHHIGPLVVQKVLYPEAEAVCHGVVVHPPGGVAGGDHLALHATLAVSSHAVLTTPGAGKWYKSGGRPSSQYLQFELAENTCLEWLPQENILFDGTEVAFTGEVHLQDNAVFAGWEIFCLGRQASGEQWQAGRLQQRLSIYRHHRLIWNERASLTPQSRQLQSAAGLRGMRVSGTFVVVAANLPTDILDACRAISIDGQALYGVTALPQVFCARYLGQSSQEARRYFEALWHLLRPWYAGRTAVKPRIWAT